MFRDIGRQAAEEAPGRLVPLGSDHVQELHPQRWRLAAIEDPEFQIMEGFRCRDPDPCKTRGGIGSSRPEGGRILQDGEHERVRGRPDRGMDGAEPGGTGFLQMRLPPPDEQKDTHRQRDD